MTDETRYFVATIPAGTTQAAPVAVSLAMPARIVRRVRWRVPPGPHGLMGWYLASGGQPVIPVNGSWIVADDESDAFLPTGTVESGAWQLIGYNTGTLPHAVYLTFDVDSPAHVQGGAVVVYDHGDLSSGGDGSGGDGSGTLPPPAATYADGYAAGRHNAQAAVAALPDAVDPGQLVARPDAATDAGTGYDAARAAALAAVGLVAETHTVDPPPAGDGYALAKVRARAALAALFGMPVVGTVPAAPAFGDPMRAAYDRGVLAARAAVARISWP